MKVPAGDVPPAAAWSAAWSFPVYRWWIERVDESDRVVIRSLQDMIEPANSGLSDGAKDSWLAGAPRWLAGAPRWSRDRDPCTTLDSPGPAPYR